MAHIIYKHPEMGTYVKGLGQKYKYSICQECIRVERAVKYCDTCLGYYSNSQICPRCLQNGQYKCRKCQEPVRNYEHICKNKGFLYCENCQQKCVDCKNNISNNEANKTKFGTMCIKCLDKRHLNWHCKKCRIITSMDDIRWGGKCSECCKDHVVSAPNNGVLKYMRAFGIELEFIGYPVPVNGWDIEWDRSCGYEYVSKVFNHEGYAEIQQLLNATQGKISTNELCGFHIHINARDASWKKLRQITRNFVNLKSWIFSHQPRYRRKNLHNPYNMKNYITDKIPQEDLLIKADSADEFFTHYYYPYNVADAVMAAKYSEISQVRYAPVNFHSWMPSSSKGTVEFRYPACLFDYNWIIHNINFVQHLYHLDRDVFSVEEFMSPEEIYYWESMKANKFVQFTQ